MNLAANRRLYPRIVNACLLHYIQSFPRLEGQGRTVDLGLSGLCFESTQVARVMAPMELTLSIHNQLLRIRATVTRCDEVGEGRWEVAVSFKEHSRRYMVLLAKKFADAADGRGAEAA